MNPFLRRAVFVSGMLTAALVLAGCATSSGDSGSKVGEEPGTTTPDAGGDSGDFEAAWLDDGRMIAVVTWGSSTCVPTADEVTANGQTVAVTLDEGDLEKPCTADLAARASLVVLPEGVDPTKDVELKVTIGSVTGSIDLDGNRALTGTPGDPTEYQPSAGWYDDGALVLLTWGSSTCLPVVDTAEASGSAGTVTFVSEDRACTMDMVPRTTLIDFGELDDDGDEAFTLTLVGDGLDATLEVIER